MGQKVHPYGFRLGIVKTWKSKWYEDKNYAKWLHEDLKLKTAIRKKFAHAGIAEIEIERAANKAKVVIYTSRPGIIIGKRGAGVEQLKAELQKLTENEINGPSIAKMTGVRGHSLHGGTTGMQPALSALGIKVMSIDLFLPQDDTPVLWDAPTHDQ